MSNPFAGIGVSCFNRLENVKKILTKFRHLRITNDYSVVFSSDGCTDGTQDFLREQKDIISLLSPNKGVAANKNRLLKFLKEQNFIFILEDDLLLLSRSFINDAIDIVHKTGIQHLNFGTTAKYRSVKVKGISLHCSGTLNGQLIFVTKEVLNKVGYFNVAFGRYGYEHVEYTLRVCKEGNFSCKWGPFYTFPDPQKHFKQLPEAGGMNILVKNDWAHRRNVDLYRELILQGKAKIKHPEPEQDYEVVGSS